MDDNEITARDRLKAIAMAEELETMAAENPWIGWLNRPIARLLRWMAQEDHGDDLPY